MLKQLLQVISRLFRIPLLLSRLKVNERAAESVTITRCPFYDTSQYHPTNIRQVTKAVAKEDTNLPQLSVKVHAKYDRTSTPSNRTARANSPT